MYRVGLQKDEVVRVLTGNQPPDYSEIGKFRRRGPEAPERDFCADSAALPESGHGEAVRPAHVALIGSSESQCQQAQDITHERMLRTKINYIKSLQSYAKCKGGVDLPDQLRGRQDRLPCNR